MTKKPMPTTRIKMPIRNNHWLATAYSMETPAGTCSSPTMIQLQICRSVSRAAVSNRLGTRGGGAGAGRTGSGELAGGQLGDGSRGLAGAPFVDSADPVVSRKNGSIGTSAGFGGTAGTISGFATVSAEDSAGARR